MEAVEAWDHGGVYTHMPGKLSFEVTATRRVPLKPDGTPRRNWLELDVIVDGAAHTIRLRRETGGIKCAELRQRPDWPDIKTLVVKHVNESIPPVRAACPG